MLMLRAARPATLDGYAEGIRQLSVLFPGGWGTISVADESMRAEQWDIIFEQAAGNSPVSMDPALPWDFVLGQSTYGVAGALRAHWWELRVVLPLVRGSPAAVAADVSLQLEGSAPVSGASGAGKKRVRGGAGRNQPPPRAQLPRPASSSAVHGLQFCHAWNRGAGNCPDPCPNGRLHACEHCGRDGHKGFECRSKGKGKGSKGGKR